MSLHRRLVHILGRRYSERTGRSLRDRERWRHWRTHLEGRVSHQVGDGHQVRVDVEGESTLIPGGIVRSHCVLVVDHGCHIHSLFSSVEYVIVATLNVRPSVNRTKGDLRSVEKTDGSVFRVA